jgi:hypothetical protein
MTQTFPALPRALLRDALYGDDQTYDRGDESDRFAAPTTRHSPVRLVTDFVSPLARAPRPPIAGGRHLCRVSMTLHGMDAGELVLPAVSVPDLRPAGRAPSRR